MIRLQHVEKAYGRNGTSVPALRGLDLEIPEGQMCAVMGPSGAGKSTILHVAGGLMRADAGSVRIGDRDLSVMPADDLARLRRTEVGIVFQFYNLLPYLTAEENVALPLELNHVAPSEIRERVETAFDLVGFASARKPHRPHELSGGEMQRVAIARSLVIRPRVLLADEPTGNLDSVGGRQIMDILRDINEESRLTTMIVTHDPVWASYCDRVVRVVDGKVTEDTLMPDDEPTPRPDTVH